MLRLQSLHAALLQEDTAEKVEALEARLEECIREIQQQSSAHMKACSQNQSMLERAFSKIETQSKKIDALNTRISAHAVALELVDPQTRRRVVREEKKAYERLLRAQSLAATTKPEPEDAVAVSSKRRKTNHHANSSEAPALRDHELSEEELEELLPKPEPQRYYDWLRIMFVADQEGKLAQTEIWDLYHDAFSAFKNEYPLLLATDVLKNVSDVFPKAEPVVLEGPVKKYVVQVLARRAQA